MLYEEDGYKTTVITERNFRRLFKNNFKIYRQFDLIESIVKRSYGGMLTKFAFRLTQSEVGSLRDISRIIEDYPMELTLEVCDFLNYDVFKRNFTEKVDVERVFRYFTDVSEDALIDRFHNKEIKTFASSFEIEGIDLELIDWVEVSEVFNSFMDLFVNLVIETMKLSLGVESKHNCTVMSFTLYQDKLFITFM